jgi:anti-sigma regulatory factor (Ser/Thr protein kinase)
VPVRFHVTKEGDTPARWARDEVQKIVRDWKLPLSEDAVFALRLCTMEVVANALKHAGGECWLTISSTSEHLRVEVEDRSMLLPHPWEPDEMAESGRGLPLVEALAQSWSWNPTGPGKTVFFLIRLDKAPSCALEVPVPTVPSLVPP